MEAALVAAGRGHSVTLYEKSGAWGTAQDGGRCFLQMAAADFKNYLVRQIAKSNVKVCLNTEATAEMLRGEEYMLSWRRSVRNPSYPKFQA